MRIIYFGTPDVAKETLDVLLKSDFGKNVLAVVTNPDRPVGRKHIVTPPPVKVLAEENELPVFQPEKITEEFIEEIAKLNPDLFVVVAYGAILPERLIKMPKFGTINIHYSLLPRWRGASPVEHALLHNDKETGVAIQQMVFKLDAGPIIALEKVSIDISDTQESLFAKLIPLGAELLIKTLPQIESGGVNPVLQNENEATLAPKIKTAQGEIKSDMTELEKWLTYRAFHLRPGAYFFDQNNKRTKVTDAEFKNEKFIIKEIIPDGGKRQRVGY